MELVILAVVNRNREYSRGFTAKPDAPLRSAEPSRGGGQASGTPCQPAEDLLDALMAVT